MKLNGLEQYFNTVNGEIIDFKQVAKFGYTPLIYALYTNQSKNLNLSQEQWNYLIQNSDLTQVNNDGWSPLMLALRYKKEVNLNLSEKQWDYLIKNSDLKQLDNEGWSPLLVALRYNKEANLSSEQWDCLIKNSDLKQVDTFGWSPLMLALEYNKSQNLNLSAESWKYLIDNSDLSIIPKYLHLNEHLGTITQKIKQAEEMKMTPDKLFMDKNAELLLKKHVIGSEWSEELTAYLKDKKPDTTFILKELLKPEVSQMNYSSEMIKICSQNINFKELTIAERMKFKLISDLLNEDTPQPSNRIR